MMISEAKKINKKAKVGDVLEIVLEIPGAFGRMAAQTAKQVIIQKIREAERNMVFGDFKAQEGQIVVGTIQRVEGRKILIDLGKVTGILPMEEQISREFYKPGSRMKFYIKLVGMSQRGPEVVLSRASEKLVQAIFTQEVPEISSGVVEIKGVARDPGFRSKVAVATGDSSIDPVGSCIGQRGSRINTIIDELGGEKIDIIEYNDDPAMYITKALSPAKILSVELNDTIKTADVSVASDQFSLAIGRSGQNVRLASELTGWKINLKDQGGNSIDEGAEDAQEESASGDLEEGEAEEQQVEESSETKTE
jgi:N utilization substance protein A